MMRNLGIKAQKKKPRTTTHITVNKGRDETEKIEKTHESRCQGKLIGRELGGEKEAKTAIIAQLKLTRENKRTELGALWESYNDSCDDVMTPTFNCLQIINPKTNSPLAFRFP